MAGSGALANLASREVAAQGRGPTRQWLDPPALEGRAIEKRLDKCVHTLAVHAPFSSRTMAWGLIGEPSRSGTGCVQCGLGNEAGGEEGKGTPRAVRQQPASGAAAGALSRWRLLWATRAALCGLARRPDMAPGWVRR
jgi:hypothetical protein